MAEALLKEKLEKRGITEVSVPSCGLEAQLWGTAEPRLRLVIGSSYNRLRDFRCRPISEEIVRDADLVLAMEERQVRDIVSRFPETRGKVATITGYAGEEEDVIDFLDGDHGSFLEWLKACYSTVNRCLDRIVERVSGPAFET